MLLRVRSIPRTNLVSCDRIEIMKRFINERNRREVDPGAAGFETAENTHFTHQTAT